MVCEIEDAGENEAMDHQQRNRTILSRHSWAISVLTGTAGSTCQSSGRELLKKCAVVKEQEWQWQHESMEEGWPKRTHPAPHQQLIFLFVQ